MKIACIASMPVRERGLLRVIDALAPQVDEVRVCLNGYDHTPKTRHSNVLFITPERDMGPGGKFLWANCGADYILTCDDDIGYPADYVDRMIEAVERYGRKAVICVLGDQVGGTKSIHYAHGLAADTPVNKPGTGTCAWHGSLAVPPDLPGGIFPVDPRFAWWAQENEIPCVAIARAANWLKLWRGFTNPSIYGNLAHREQGKAFVRGKTWRLFDANCDED